MWLSSNSNQLLLSFYPGSAARRPDLIPGGGGQPERGSKCRFWFSLTYKVSNEGAVKVGDLLHASRDVGGSRGTTGVTTGLFFVVVITKDKAQQESRHHNVSNAQHREMTASGAGRQCHMSGMPHCKILVSSSYAKSISSLRSERIYLNGRWKSLLVAH